LRQAIGGFQAFLIVQIWDTPDVLERFQISFWKLHLLPKKPRILWISGNILLCPFEVIQFGIFNAFGMLFIKDNLRNLT
jgi:hypothetical protein